MRTIHLAWLLGLVGACAAGDDAPPTDETDPVGETDTDPPEDTDDTDADDDTDVDDTDPSFTYLDDPVPGAWGDGFVMPGFVGESAARVVDVVRLADGRLVAGGIFDFVTGDPVQNIAVYDEATNSWSALDGNPPSPFYVEHLEVLSDGRLVAVGWSSGFIGGMNGAIAVWDDGVWTDLSPGIGGRVYTVHELDDGTLLFGGDFSWVGALEAAGLVGFDGADFFDPGVFTPDDYPSVRSVFRRDGFEYCISGLFEAAGGVEVSKIACFDGADWSAWGEHDSEVFGVAQLSDGTWMSWGTFGFGDPGANEYSVGIGVWDGTRWWYPDELGIDGGMVASVRDLLPVEDGGYYVVGEFDGVGGHWGAGASIPAANVAYFDGDAWQPLGMGVYMTSGVVAANVPGGYALHRDDDGILWIGGLFQQADTLMASGLASWDPVAGVMSAPFDLNVTPGIDGNGLFVEVAGDGTVWVVVESATTGYVPTLLQMGTDGRLDDLHSGPSGHVTALVQDQGDLYVSGDLGGLGRGDCDVARYRAGAWSCVVRGLGGVAELATDGAGRFVIAGDFEGPGGSQNIAWFDGTELKGLGDGFNGNIRQVELAPDGTIYIHGYEDPPSIDLLPTERLAQWTGTAWEDLGDWESGAVNDLAWYDGKLLIAGSYMRRLPTDPGEPVGEEIGLLVAWDGTELTAWGEIEYAWEFGGGTYLLRPWRDGLFVYGSYDRAGGVDVPGGLAWFDGATWHPLGEGTDDLITDLAVGDDEVWFVGPFHAAGGEPSFGIARWEVEAP